MTVFDIEFVCEANINHIYIKHINPTYFTIKRLLFFMSLNVVGHCLSSMNTVLYVVNRKLATEDSQDTNIFLKVCICYIYYY